jgi:hypothetical protein
MWHARERGEVHTEFWWENLKGKEYLEDIDTDGIILKWISKNEKLRVSAGMTWLKIVRSDGLLWTR